MKALTLWQPWASAIALGYKHHETRGWKTKYRGIIAIHAAKRPIPSNSPANAYFTKAAIADFPLGKIVAIAEIVDCLPVEDVLSVSISDRLFGDWSEGRFAWQLENIRALKEPVPYKGMQGLWTLPDDIVLETS